MDTNIEEKIEEVLSQCIITREPRPIPKGLHTCGMMRSDPIVMEHPDLDLKIIVSHHRSEYKNRELAKKLFKVFLTDIVK